MKNAQKIWRFLEKSVSPGESLLDGWEKMCPGIGTMVNPGRPYVTPSGLLDGMGRALCHAVVWTTNVRYGSV